MRLTYADVVAAREITGRHLRPTPLARYASLDGLAGTTVLVKHENEQPTGAFKIRGGLVLLDGMTPAERRRGTVTYSTGNHAQSMAYASRLYDAPCTVVMPAAASPSKIAAVRSHGATVVLTGDTIGEAQAHAEKLADGTGARLISPGDTPELLAGVGTLYREIFEVDPDVDAVVVPVGSGTGAAAATVVARELAPDCAVYAVQSSASPAAHDSWAAGSLLKRPNTTVVDGLATGRGFALPQSLLRDALAGFLLVSDAEIAGAQRLLHEHTGTVVEGAGAAALAAVLARPALFAGRRVAVACTGGNASPAELAALSEAALS